MNLMSKGKKLLSQGPKSMLKILRRRARFEMIRVSRLLKDFYIRLGLFSKHDKIHILYVTSRFEMEMGQTVRYRILNLKKALKGRAYTRFELIENVYNDETAVKWADIVVFMRVQWTPQSHILLQLAKQFNTAAVFDIDDIIFLPEYAENYCTALGKSRGFAEDYRMQFGMFEQMFSACDFATASTPFIADKMIKAGKQAFVIHNGLNSRQIRIAESVKHKQKTSVRYIGYLSGTKTHDRDFKTVLPAIERIVSERPDSGLWIAGYLDTSMFSPELKNKTQVAGFMPWQKLIHQSAKNYVNIAPLDIKNPFCHAKSELKYFEAAAVGVPTVASATDTFSRCIENGKNGMLAETEEDWYYALKKLFDDSALYKKIAGNAKEHAFKNYSPDAIANEAQLAYSEIIKKYREGK